MGRLRGARTGTFDCDPVPGSPPRSRFEACACRRGAIVFRPQLLPDEHVESYRGALERFNGVSGANAAKRKAETLKLVDDWHERSIHASPQTPFERLAAVAGVSPAHLRQHHTMWPILAQRTAASSPIFEESLRRPSGVETVKAAACFCSDCAASDLSSYGRSYWRREHQLPGIYWCSKHRCGLRAVRRRHALLLPPSTLLDESDEFDFDWVTTLLSDKFIARYVDVLHAVLDAPEQLPAIAIRDALRLVARPLGYQVHPNDGKISSTTRAVLSREVFELFPEKWVTQTFPCCARPSDTKVQFWLDGTLWMKTPSTSVAGYALAAAMLFKSGDVFMHAVRHGQLDDGSLTSAESEKGPRVRWALLQSSKEANAAAETNEQASRTRSG